MYVCMYACMHACMCRYMYVGKHPSMHVCSCISMHVVIYPDMILSPKPPVVVTKSPAVNRNFGDSAILRHTDLLLKVPLVFY